MRPLVIFTEEPSAALVVRALARGLVPHRSVIVVEHEGRSDLEQSFPRKIAAWQHPRDTRFLVVRDNDGADCVVLKRRLTDLAPGDQNHLVRFRLVMQELEAWYLGALDALLAAGVIKVAQLKSLRTKKKYRDVERLTNAKEEFLKLASTTGQLALARQIGPELAKYPNSSRSFVLFAGLLTTEW